MISKLTTGEYSSMTRARILRSFRSQNRVSRVTSTHLRRSNVVWNGPASIDGQIYMSLKP